MSENNVVEYQEFRIRQLLKNKSENIKIKDNDAFLLSSWLSKNTNLDSPIYKEIIQKRDNKEELSDIENIILRGWAIKKSQHAASKLSW